MLPILPTPNLSEIPRASVPAMGKKFDAEKVGMVALQLNG